MFRLTATLGCMVLFTVLAAGRADGAAVGDPPTFNRDVAPIVFSKCVVCHRADEVGPFPLTGYEEVRRRARQIARVTERRIMPPWKPDPGHNAFKSDRSLTDEQVAVFKAWAEAGAPAGDPKDLPPAPQFPSGWHLGEPDMVLKLPRPFTIPAESQDIYVHFVFPMKLTQDKYIRAVQVLPSNRRVAHHGVILLDGSGNARRLAAAHGGDHYLNAGDPGFLTRGFLPGFAPGQVTRPVDESDEACVGLTLAKGLDIVLQMHYHPTGKEETDQPQIGLYFTDRKPKRGPNIIGMANNDVDIPPGEKPFERRDSFTLPVDFEVRDIWGHMHLLGKSLKVWADFPGGEAKHMLSISDWDFNWQDSYVYKQPFVLPKGTVVRAQWTWDDSADNPRSPYSPPRRVQWVPQSTDEMSGLIIGGITVNTGWDEGVMWLSVIGHYLEIEKRAKEAAARRRAGLGADPPVEAPAPPPVSRPGPPDANDIGTRADEELRGSQEKDLTRRLDALQKQAANLKRDYTNVIAYLDARDKLRLYSGTAGQPKFDALIAEQKARLAELGSVPQEQIDAYLRFREEIVGDMRRVQQQIDGLQKK